MKTIKIYLIFSCLTIIFFQSGCTEKRKLYPGPKLSKSEVAILKIRKETHVKKLMMDGGNEVEHISGKNIDCVIVPGKHEISWIGCYPGTSFDYIGAGTLNAKAGKQYVITFSMIYGELIKQSGGWSTYNVKSYETTIQEYKPLDFSNILKDYCKTEDFTPYGFQKPDRAQPDP